MTRQEQRTSRIAEEHPALICGLQATVPLLILELAALRPAEREAVRRGWASDAATEVGSKGDVLQYGSRRRGKAAQVFNHLARGLAASAFQPGGITFAGQHWCTEHAVCEGADAEVSARRATPDRDPDASTEPADAGEWYGTRPVQTVQPRGELL